MMPTRALIGMWLIGTSFGISLATALLTGAGTTYIAVFVSFIVTAVVLVYSWSKQITHRQRRVVRHD